MREEPTPFESTILQTPPGMGAGGARTAVVAPEKYRLVRLLGSGGFGAVWLAEDLVLQRQVALKFLGDVRASDVERFRREARMSARLADPAVIKVYEFGEHAGVPYIAMQFVDGTSLAEAEIEPSAALRILRPVALALDHAHSLGIIHRDIKPPNILLDREGRSYLTDFGIARDLRAGHGSTLTVEGALVGTPAFMSPEQARGDNRAVDARSDVYALGATLFFLLTRRPPFDASNLVDLLHAVIHEDPPFPRSFNPSIPRAVESIALKCLRKDRSGRYANMQELVADMDRVLAGQACTSESVPWLRKLVGAPAPRPRESDEIDPDLPAVLEIAREVARWDADLYRISTNICRTYPKLDGLVTRLDEILARRPDHAAARFYRGLALFRRGRLREALDEMERAIDRVGETAGAHFELGRLHLALYLREHSRAQRHIEQEGVDQHLATARGRLQQAVVAFQEAERIRGDLPPWQIDFVHAVERLAGGDPAGCVAACDAIIARDPDVEQIWKTRGDALRMAGRDPIESYDRAIEVRRSFEEAHLAKAETYLERGAFIEARASAARAIDLCPESTDALSLASRIDLAEARVGGGAPCLERALMALEKITSLDPESYEAVVALAEVRLELGRSASCAASLDAALVALTAARGLEGCQNRVNLLEARVLLERARRTRSRGGDPTPDLEAILRHRAGAYSQTSANDPWQEVFREAEGMRRR